MDSRLKMSGMTKILALWVTSIENTAYIVIPTSVYYSNRFLVVPTNPVGQQDLPALS